MKRFLLLLFLLPTYNQAGNYIDYPAVAKTAAVVSAAALVPTTISFFVTKKLNRDAHRNNNRKPFDGILWKGVLLTDAASIITAVGINAALGQHHINPYTMGALLVGAPAFLALKPGSFSGEPKETKYSAVENFVINYSKKRDMLREYRAGLVGFALFGLYNYMTQPKKQDKANKK